MRSGTLKNILFVVMIASCYITVRLVIVNHRIPHNQPHKELGQNVVHKPHEVPAIVLPSTNHVNNKVQAEAQLSAMKCGSSLLDTPNSILEREPSYRDVTCHSLLYSHDLDSTQYSRAKVVQTKHSPLKVTNEQFIQDAKDCKKLQVAHGYHMKPVNEEERLFPIAYNILTHRDIQQVELLLRAIYRPQNVYCVHVDDKQDANFKEAITALADCFSNVYVATKLEQIVYAGFTRLQADLNCMSDQLKQPIKWKYLLNIAAQSFPLKSNLEMVRILKLYNGSNDVEGIYGARIHRGRYKLRFELEWKEVNIGTNKAKVEKTGGKNPPPPGDIDLVRGSAYGIFSRDFVHYILHDEKAKALLEWSRKTYSPDEHYWATLHHTYSNPHLHPPGGFKGKPDSKPWLAVWVAWGGVDKCHGRWKRGTCVFGVQDLPMLISRHEFFANKFYFDHHPLVLECLNNWIEFKVKCRPPLDMDYYKKLPFLIKGS